MKPSLGRIVHYTLESGRICPAMIVGIPKLSGHPETTINLQVFMPAGTLMIDVADYSEMPTKQCWNWPPREPS